MSDVHPSSKKIVFIIEDDRLLSRTYEVQLQSEGFEVWSSGDGAEALARLKGDPPSLILLDLMLPGASGFDVLAAIRTTPTWKGVPVLVLSNLGQSEDIQKAHVLGVQDYLVKSNVRFDDVIEAIKKHIQ